MMEALPDRWMEGWTDTKNFRRHNIIPSPLFVVGHKNGNMNFS